jgi:hypothetical protein
VNFKKRLQRGITIGGGLFLLGFSLYMIVPVWLVYLQGGDSFVMRLWLWEVKFEPWLLAVAWLMGLYSFVIILKRR